jgi:hypothetical protein
VVDKTASKRGHAQGIRRLLAVGDTKTSKANKYQSRRSKTNSEGPAKKIDGSPHTFAKSQTHPPTCRLFFPLDFFCARFWALLGKGGSKTPEKYVKSPCRKIFQTNRKKNRCQFLLDFFWFYQVFGCFSAM